MVVKTKKHFSSQKEKVGLFAIDVDNSEIKKEPMFFNSDFDYAYLNGGKITRSFLDNLPDGWRIDVVFDSRIHMLMPGWYPSIPGWHHDDVPRPEIPVGQHFISAGQPDYENTRYFSEHIFGLVNADVCPTEFAIGDCEMPVVEDGETVYKKWHTEVEGLVNSGELKLELAEDRTLYYFDWQCFHTGVKAKKNGWRWFGRISRNTDRVKTVTNEIRMNAQVYLEFPMEGW